MSTETVWRLLVGQTMYMAFVMVIVFRSGGKAKGEVSLSDEPLWILIPLRVAGLLMWGSVIFYLASPAAFHWGLFSLPWSVRVAGLVLALFSIPFILWMFKHIGLNLTPTVQTRREHNLVTSGPYHWIRHPLYTFAGIFFLGICLAIASWVALVGWFLGGVFLRIRLPLEEQGLIERFGEEYQSYMAQTGAFFPKWRKA